MKKKWIPYLLVALQLAAILAILFSAPMLCDNLYLLAVEIFGILLGVSAIYTMRVGNFNMTPIPKQAGILRTTGVFRFIRHPMYLANLIALLPLVIEYYTSTRLLIYIDLWIVLLFKLNIEEGMLMIQFPEYEDYKKTSWKLIPFVY